jgi:hypothetical protein
MDKSENQPEAPNPNSTLGRVMSSAAKLQSIVPDAVLVGGSAAALYAGHRESYDHDHVLADLAERFDLVLEALEATDGWVTNRVRPKKIILGSLGDIEAGVRQMIRKRPLQTTQVRLATGDLVNVPTPDETIRIKAFLLVARNQTRDFLDVAALADSVGIDHAAAVISDMDSFYADQHGEGDGVASQCTRQLSKPQPADARVTGELAHYKGLADRWHDWKETVTICERIADAVIARS